VLLPHPRLGVLMILSLDDLVDCKLCGAMTTRERRASHIEWHARINARLKDVAEIKAKVAL